MALLEERTLGTSEGAEDKIGTLKAESSCGELHNAELRVCTFDELSSP